MTLCPTCLRPPLDPVVRPHATFCASCFALVRGPQSYAPGDRPEKGKVNHKPKSQGRRYQSPVRPPRPRYRPDLGD